MNIKITADSTCDLSEELLRQWNISLMPMHILMGDDTYLDGVTIHPADVFAHVYAGLQSLANRVELSFVLNQLNYMAKSGRCSGVLAFGANILGIKPSLAIIDGELKVVRKYRGSLPICVGKYITDLLDGRDDIDNSMVFISSCQPKPGCMEAIKAGLRKYGKFENIIETDIGTTIGGYSGPGTIGIVFAKKV